MLAGPAISEVPPLQGRSQGAAHSSRGSPRISRASRLGIFLSVLRIKGKGLSCLFANPSLVLTAGTNEGTQRFVVSGAISMLMTSERRPAIRPLRGWAIHVLLEAGAVRECEEHGWMQDRADPHARDMRGSGLSMS